MSTPIVFSSGAPMGSPTNPQKPIAVRQHDFTYHDLLLDIRQHGRHKSDRTGTGTTALFGYQMRFDITHNIIPLLTTKKMYLPAIVHEIIWYLSGSSNIKYLQQNGVRIWNEWADANGDLGPVYGYQWRQWPHMHFNPERNTDAIYCDREGDTEEVYAADVRIKYIDQIAQVISDLKNNPDSRRIIVSAWNVAQIAEMKLPPCHYTFQFYSEEMTLDERIEWWRGESRASDDTETHATHAGLDFLLVPRRWLSCMLNQRSADAFLGVPFNIAQYSIITALIAKQVGMASKDFIWSGGDCHIYDNHHPQVDEQLRRMPYLSPRVVINPAMTNIDNLQYGDISFEDYVSHGAIKAQVAV